MSVYTTGLFARCWAFVAVCERKPVLTGRQQSYPYLPLADTFFTIHVVYSKKRAAGLFKICDAITKNTQKSLGFSVFCGILLCLKEVSSWIQ